MGRLYVVDGKRVLGGYVISTEGGRVVGDVVGDGDEEDVGEAVLPGTRVGEGVGEGVEGTSTTESLGGGGTKRKNAAPPQMPQMIAARNPYQIYSRITEEDERAESYSSSSTYWGCTFSLLSRRGGWL